MIGILLLVVACGLVARHFDALPHISFGTPAPNPAPRLSNFTASMVYSPDGTLSKGKTLNGVIDEQHSSSLANNNDGALYLAPTPVDDPAYADPSGEESFDGFDGALYLAPTPVDGPAYADPSGVESFDGALYLEPTPVDDPAYADPSGVESFDGFPEDVDDGSNFYVEPNQPDSSRRAAAPKKAAPAAAAAVVLKAHKTKRKPQAATATRCKYKSGGKATGKPCKKMAVGGAGSEFCERHTCSVDGCLNSKASSGARCVHCSTQAIVNSAYEYVDVTTV